MKIMNLFIIFNSFLIIFNSFLTVTNIENFINKLYKNRKY